MGWVRVGSEEVDESGKMTRRKKRKRKRRQGGVYQDEGRSL